MSNAKRRKVSILSWLSDKWSNWQKINARVVCNKQKFLNRINIEHRKPTAMNRIYNVILCLCDFSIYTYMKAKWDDEDKSFLVEEIYSLPFLLLLPMLVFIFPWIYYGYFYRAIVEPFIYWVCYFMTLVFVMIVPIYRILGLLIAHLKIILLQSESGTRTDDGYIIARHA